MKEQENYFGHVGNVGCCEVTSHSWDIFWHFYKAFEMQSKARTVVQGGVPIKFLNVQGDQASSGLGY